MIARLIVRTAFTIDVPEGVQFEVPTYESNGYVVCFYPPKRSKEEEARSAGKEVTIDGTATFSADLIHIDFVKNDFNRSRDIECDPPFSLIKDFLDHYLIRLRHITKSPIIRASEFPHCDWRLNYLDDDGKELSQVEGLLRKRGGMSFSVSWIALTGVMWRDIHAIPDDHVFPPWEELLLDAAFPGTSVGNSIVLAATALEVFVAHVLDVLASDSPTPKELWTWINNRQDHLREPSVEEQFDVLLKMMCGHSLKEDSKLWEAFKNLRAARNSFVHSGMARIGKSGEVLDDSKAKAFVASALAVIEKVKSWLPEKHRWKQYSYPMEVKASISLNSGTR